MELPELTTQERDYRMLEARKQGYNYREIGRAFSVSSSTAHAGVKRALQKEAKRHSDDMSTVGWLFLERYDSLLRDLTPFTKAQKAHDAETGKEIQIPPSYEAVDRYLKTMNDMKKLLGLDQDHIQLDIASAGGGPSVDDGTSAGEMSPEVFAKDVLAELLRVGAIGGSDADVLKGLIGQNVVDAEVVEDSEMAEIGPAQDELTLPSITEPKILDNLPEWVDEDEEDVAPGDWVPDDLDNASKFDAE